MTHPFDVVGLVTNLKAGVAILRLIENGYKSMDVTEARLKLATVSSTLLEAVNKLNTAQQALEDRDAQIADLRSALEIAGSVSRVNDAYYVCDSAGQPKGQAFCVRCWEDDHKLRGLVRARDGGTLVHRCQVCKEMYDEAYSASFEE